MIVHRVFPLDRSARRGAPGSPLFWPRFLQGAGRHDNPDRYGCMYVSQSETAALAEALAVFRGAGPLHPGMLERAGLPLGLAAIQIEDPAGLVDLDEPEVLLAEGLRPSRVATRRRRITQPDAARLFEGHPDALGLRWWSTLESLWANVTLFDRAEPRLTVEGTRLLSTADDAVREAAAFLGLQAPG